MKLKELKERVRDWYRGKYVGMSDQDGIFISGHTVRPWLARVFDFICREYKWLIGVFIALLMAYLAYRH